MCFGITGCSAPAKTGFTEKNIVNNANKANTSGPSLSAATETPETENRSYNPFFFKEDTHELTYSGRFLFNEIIEKDVKLYINKIDIENYGFLYELIIEPVEDVSPERLSLGYFYVRNDRIYKVDSGKENLELLKLSDGIPNDSIIVCQDEAIEDSLDEDEPGWHYFLNADGDRREYHAYNNQVSTGYYETIIWERDKGLVYYRSRYGADKDLIEIQIK